MVVHYLGHPADMDPIMAIARKHNVKVIEDVSHAQGGLYKGRKVGTFGDVAAMSLMTGKSLAIGEAGILVTDDRRRYERAVALGHYERFDASDREPRPEAVDRPAAGRVQVPHAPDVERGRPGAAQALRRAHGRDPGRDELLLGPAGGHARASRRTGRRRARAARWGAGTRRTGSTGPRSSAACPRPASARPCAPRASRDAAPGANLPLHLHPLFNDADVYGHGKPTRIAHSDRDLRQPPGSLPVTEATVDRVLVDPVVQATAPELIDEYVAAFRKVSAGYRELLAGDKGNPPEVGGWHFFTRR